MSMLRLDSSSVQRRMVVWTSATHAAIWWAWRTAAATDGGPSPYRMPTLLGADTVTSILARRNIHPPLCVGQGGGVRVGAVVPAVDLVGSSPAASASRPAWAAFTMGERPPRALVPAVGQCGEGVAIGWLEEHCLYREAAGGGVGGSPRRGRPRVAGHAGRHVAPAPPAPARRGALPSGGPPCSPAGASCPARPRTVAPVPSHTPACSPMSV
jgi:hypothetical protein